jgi:hypothetical protein
MFDIISSRVETEQDLELVLLGLRGRESNSVSFVQPKKENYWRLERKSSLSFSALRLSLR